MKRLTLWLAVTKTFRSTDRSQTELELKDMSSSEKKKVVEVWPLSGLKCSFDPVWDSSE